MRALAVRWLCLTVKRCLTAPSQLSTNFYDLVYNDPDPAHAGFKNQFLDTPIELSIHNQVCASRCYTCFRAHTRTNIANVFCAEVRRARVLRRHGEGVYTSVHACVCVLTLRV